MLCIKLFLKLQKEKFVIIYRCKTENLSALFLRIYVHNRRCILIKISCRFVECTIIYTIEERELSS